MYKFALFIFQNKRYTHTYNKKNQAYNKKISIVSMKLVYSLVTK